MTKQLGAHHLPIDSTDVTGNGKRGRLFFLPGSDGRARRISERFDQPRIVTSDRQHNVYLGRLKAEDITVDVGAVSTGMGCPSLSIVVTELIGLGARLFIRVGTSGSVRPDVVRVGNLVIASCGVRNEGTSDRYICRDYPAVGDPDLIAALERASLKLGYGDQTYKGPVLAKDSLFAMEFGHGPGGAENEAYLKQLRALRVLASDMETSHLFVLADVHSSEIVPISKPPSPNEIVKSGVILAVIGDDSPYALPEAVRKAEETAIEVALEGALELFRAWKD